MQKFWILVVLGIFTLISQAQAQQSWFGAEDYNSNYFPQTRLRHTRQGYYGGGSNNYGWSWENNKKNLPTTTTTTTQKSIGTYDKEKQTNRGIIYCPPEEMNLEDEEPEFGKNSYYAKPENIKCIPRESQNDDQFSTRQFSSSQQQASYGKNSYSEYDSPTSTTTTTTEKYYRRKTQKPSWVPEEKYFTSTIRQSQSQYTKKPSIKFGQESDYNPQDEENERPNGPEKLPKWTTTTPRHHFRERPTKPTVGSKFPDDYPDEGKIPPVTGQHKGQGIGEEDYYNGGRKLELEGLKKLALFLLVPLWLGLLF